MTKRTQRMKLVVRMIDLARATIKTGVANIAYHILLLVWLELLAKSDASPGPRYDDLAKRNAGSAPTPQPAPPSTTSSAPGEGFSNLPRMMGPVPPFSACPNDSTQPVTQVGKAASDKLRQESSKTEEKWASNGSLHGNFLRICYETVCYL